MAQSSSGERTRPLNHSQDPAFRLGGAGSCPCRDGGDGDLAGLAEGYALRSTH